VKPIVLLVTLELIFVSPVLKAVETIHQFVLVLKDLLKSEEIVSNVI
jgi:hypothetical protein